MSLPDLILALSAAVPAVLSLLLLAECLAACLPRRESDEGRRVPVDILIPAHNEARILPETLAALQGEIADGDRVWVVADNCSDGTAEVARLHGAGVMERSDPSRRGKGFALQFAIDRLRGDHRPAVVILDADCRFEERGLIEARGLERMIRRAAGTGRPVQSLYHMTPPERTARGAISQFAVLVKNRVRPRGLSRLGGPCLLTGSGMAFPWPALERVSLANDNTADDMQLSCELTLAGCPPLFCEAAVVTAAMPGHVAAANVQRKRWLHGHLLTAVRFVPRLLARAVCRGDLTALAMALEVAVPPLSLLVLLLAGGTAISVVVAALGFGWTSLLVWAAAAVLLSAALLVAWLGFGRGTVSGASLAAVPAHVLQSILSSLELTVRRQHWTPTPRDLTESHTETSTP